MSDNEEIRPRAFRLPDGTRVVRFKSENVPEPETITFGSYKVELGTGEHLHALFTRNLLLENDEIDAVTGFESLDVSGKRAWNATAAQFMRSLMNPLEDSDDG